MAITYMLKYLDINESYHYAVSNTTPLRPIIAVCIEYISDTNLLNT